MSGRDATPQEELVYCHQCQEEWYKNDTGLICPRCHSDFTEVIDPDFDPREPDPSDLLDGHNPWRDIADPEEDDPSDFEFDRSGPNGPTYNIRQEQHGSLPNDAGFGSPFDMIRGPFTQMIQGIIGGGRGQPSSWGVAGPSPGFEGPAGPPGNHQGFRSMRTAGGGTRIEFFASGPTFTIRSTNFSGPPGGGEGRAPGMADDQYQRMMEIISGTLRMATPMGAGTRVGGGPDGLQSFLNAMFNPGNAAHGDFVYSQEALDRVISQLMEQHASGNAPPPASPAVIASLPRKLLTKDMLDEDTGKADCSICMEDVPVGVEVVTLPCKHWFHFECVELWLKEHDTCPVCRSGITPKEGPRDTARSPGEAPLHDEDPFLLARQQSGSRQHPFYVPESPTRERRRPSNTRRESGNESRPYPTPQSPRQPNADENGGGIGSRLRNLFSRDGNGSDRRP